AFAHAARQELLHRALGPPRLEGREVDVVEEHDEGAAAVDLGGRVGGDPRTLHGRGGRRGGRKLDRLEGGDVLGVAVLGQCEVLAPQAGDGRALLVRDHHVHGDLLDLRGEGRALGVGGGSGPRGRGVGSGAGRGRGRARGRARRGARRRALRSLRARGGGGRRREREE